MLAFGFRNQCGDALQQLVNELLVSAVGTLAECLEDGLHFRLFNVETVSHFRELFQQRSNILQPFEKQMTSVNLTCALSGVLCDIAMSRSRTVAMSGRLDGS